MLYQTCNLECYTRVHLQLAFDYETRDGLQDMRDASHGELCEFS